MYPRIAVELSLELDQAREEIAQGSSVVHICQAVGLAPSNVGNDLRLIKDPFP
jgi:hypothetical protein